jgi:hypothetical protein
MSKFMQGIAGNKNKVVSAQEIDAIADTLHANIEAPAKATTVVTKLKATPKTVVAKVMETPEPPKSKRPADTHRLTIDIPDELIEQMKRDTKRSGQTIKGFIVSLIYDFYESKGA